MTVYLCNSFTLSMIMPDLLESGVVIKASPISLGELKALLKEGFVSAVGHESTAKVLSKLLGTDVPFNRAQISIKEGDVIVSFQFLVRLPEGHILKEDEVMALYNEGKIKFFKIELLFPVQGGEGILALYETPARLYIWQERRCDLCGEITKVVCYHRVGEWDGQSVDHLFICKECVKAILASPLVCERLNYCPCNCGG
jgi:hypothetical protein